MCNWWISPWPPRLSSHTPSPDMYRNNNVYYKIVHYYTTLYYYRHLSNPYILAAGQCLLPYCWWVCLSLPLLHGIAVLLVENTLNQKESIAYKHNTLMMYMYIQCTHVLWHCMYLCEYILHVHNVAHLLVNDDRKPFLWNFSRDIHVHVLTDAWGTGCLVCWWEVWHHSPAQIRRPWGWSQILTEKNIYIFHHTSTPESHVCHRLVLSSIQVDPLYTGTVYNTSTYLPFMEMQANNRSVSCLVVTTTMHYIS